MSMNAPAPLLPIWPDTGQALGGLGRTMVFELLKTGQIRSVRIGRRRFVIADSVTEYVRRLDAEQNGTLPGAQVNAATLAALQEDLAIERAQEM